MKREMYRITRLESALLVVLSSCRYRVNMYEGKERNDSESTSRPYGVEVKLRPCIHEIYLTLFVQTLILFCKYFGIEKWIIML